MNAFVFHLAKRSERRVFQDVILRFAFNPECEVAIGDIWTLQIGSGAVVHYRIVNLHEFITEHGEELHAYCIPDLSLLVPAE